MKKMIAAAVCLLAVMTVVGVSIVAKNTRTNTVTMALKVGNLRPGGNTPVFNASESKEMEKIDLSDITKTPIGLNLEDMGRFDFSSATSDTCALPISAALSAGGNPMLHVATLYVDRNTRAILGAVATNLYPTVEAGAYALTNRMVFAVAQKKNPCYVPLQIGKDGVGRYIYEWDDAEGRRIEMVNNCIVNKARQMYILTFIHAKGDDLTITPVKP